jgi:hypothetical protein
MFPNSVTPPNPVILTLPPEFATLETFAPPFVPPLLVIDTPTFTYPPALINTFPPLLLIWLFVDAILRPLVLNDPFNNTFPPAEKDTSYPKFKGSFQVSPCKLIPELTTMSPPAVTSKL